MITKSYKHDLLGAHFQFLLLFLFFNNINDEKPELNNKTSDLLFNLVTVVCSWSLVQS